MAKLLRGLQPFLLEIGYKLWMKIAKFVSRSISNFFRSLNRAFFKASSDWRVIWEIWLLLMFNLRKMQSFLSLGVSFGNRSFSIS